MRRLSSRRRVPCQRLLLRLPLLFLHSRASCPSGCCIDSPHAATSHLPAPLPGGLGPGGRSLGAAAFSSCHAVASRSAALAPLVRLVVALPLLTPSRPLPAPPPLVASSPLVPPLLCLLSGWLLHSRPPRPPTPAPPTSHKQGACMSSTNHRSRTTVNNTTYCPPPPAPALVLPGGGISKLPLCGRDTGLKGRERQCRRRTACGGAIGDVVVIYCIVRHPPRPHLRACPSWPWRRQRRL